MIRKTVVFAFLFAFASVSISAAASVTTCQALLQTSAAQRKQEIAEAVKQAILPPEGAKPLPLHVRQAIRDCAVQAVEAARIQVLGTCAAGEDPTEDFSASVDAAVAACVTSSSVDDKDARAQFGKVLKAALTPNPS